LWSWANTASNLPPEVIEAAEMMRQFGEQQEITEFTRPQLELGELDGHLLSLIASGICKANAYYRAPYDGGAAFLLIRDDRFPKQSEPPLARIVKVFPEALAALPIQNHRLALSSYLDYYGIPAKPDGDSIVVHDGEEPALTANFDEQDRLTSLDVTIKP
jgi:hypothetical protein